MVHRAGLLVMMMAALAGGCSRHTSKGMALPPTTAPAATLTYELTRPGDINTAVDASRRRLGEFFLPESAVQAQGANRMSVALPAGFPLSADEVDWLLLPHAPLEFRIAVTAPEVTDDQKKTLEGSDESTQTAGGTKVRWVMVAKGHDRNFPSTEDVTRTTADGRFWVLCHDDADHILTHDPPTAAWTVDASVPYADPGWMVMPFHLSAVAAAAMDTISSSNPGKPLVMIYDHQALTAPIINGRISAEGELTFGNTKAESQREAAMLKAALDTASLPPLPLRRVP